MFDFRISDTGDRGLFHFSPKPRSPQELARIRATLSFMITQVAKGRRPTRAFVVYLWFPLFSLSTFLTRQDQATPQQASQDKSVLASARAPPYT